MGEIALYLYWPALSQSWNLTQYPPIFLSLKVKSYPIVVETSSINSQPINCRIREVFPTALLPTKQTLINLSICLESYFKTYNKA
jgi:hypothetical protein